jgi:hypothetical protein
MFTTELFYRFRIASACFAAAPDDAASNSLRMFHTGNTSLRRDCHIDVSKSISDQRAKRSHWSE